MQIDEINVDNIPLDDQAVYDDLKKGLSIGVFQMESSGMREKMIELQPDNFDDIMALISLYRPGPLGSGMDKMYINRKHGREPIAYPHPLLRDVLDQTYGIMLYQEDVINVATTLAGFTVEDSDQLRKVIGKKIMSKVGEYREKFVEGCRSTHGVSSGVSNKIYSDIEYFAGYGFNKCMGVNTNVVTSNGTLITVGDIVYMLGQGFEVSLRGFEIGSQKTIPDRCLEAIDAGIQELFEVKFMNGGCGEYTMSHKFLCDHDNKYHELGDIAANGWSLVTYVTSRSTTKVESMSPLGEQQCYNLSMESSTHNYVTDGGLINKNSHAASYAILSYTTAYLKHYYPGSYMAALLTSVAADKEKLTIYLNECRRMGINVSSPSIQLSYSDFTVLGDEQDILFGLSAIKGLGASKVEAILGERDTHGSYTGIHDFMRKCNIDVLNKATLEHLARSGAIDDLVADVEEKDITRESKISLLDDEKAEIGIYVTEHPLTDVWDHIKQDVSCTVLDLPERRDNSEVRIGGLISSKKRIVTKTNKVMYKLVFQDLTGDVEVIIFPRTAEKIMEEHLEEGTIGILHGKVSHEGDEENFSTRIIYDTLHKVDLDDILGGPPITLQSPSKMSALQLKRIRDIINGAQGDSRVYLSFPEGNHTVTMRFTKTTSINRKQDLEIIVNTAAKQNMEF